MAKRKIAVLVGSLRKESLNRKFARLLIGLAPDDLDCTILEIGGLPLYNPDLEETPPPEWMEFRTRLKGFEGLLFVTPEYNRSIPSALKNAIDVGSRPRELNFWEGKPGAIVTVSPGALGGFGANHHLRQMLVTLDVPVMPKPEAYIGNARSLLDSAGNLANESTRTFLQKFMLDFASWVGKLSRRSA